MSPLLIFFCGLCMGTADLIPGISGGTIAFIMGFYQPLLDSLKTLNLSSFKLFVTLQWKAFFQCVAWKFLVPLVTGMVCAILSLSSLLHLLMNHEVYRTYLYAGFLGLILASFILCLRQVKHWSWQAYVGLLAGVLVAYVLTDSTLAPKPTEPYAVHILDPWLVICGAIAVCALLLPGISGSYLLTLFGVYPTIIAALANLLMGFKHLYVDTEAFSILFNLSLGIFIGAIGFARVVSALLRLFPTVSLTVLSGFMIGALRAVWPFWSYSLGQGSQLVPLHPVWPVWTPSLAWQTLCCAGMGCAAVFLIDYVATRHKKLDRERGHGLAL